MKKKLYLMFEMHNRISFASRCFYSLKDARLVLEELRTENDPTLNRIAVGFWEEIPIKDSGNLKIFNICMEYRRISK